MLVITHWNTFPLLPVAGLREIKVHTYVCIVSRRASSSTLLQYLPFWHCTLKISLFHLKDLILFKKNYHASWKECHIPFHHLLQISYIWKRCQHLNFQTCVVQHLLMLKRDCWNKSGWFLMICWYWNGYFSAVDMLLIVRVFCPPIIAFAVKNSLFSWWCQRKGGDFSFCFFFFFFLTITINRIYLQICSFVYHWQTITLKSLKFRNKYFLKF